MSGMPGPPVVPPMTLRRLWASQRSVWLTLGLMLLLADTLVAGMTALRYREYMGFQNDLMRASVRGTVGEIEMLIQERRRAVHLLAEKESGLLRQLVREPDNARLFEQLNRTVRRHFPDAFAVTLADNRGKPYVIDFDGLVGEICERDLKVFATNREHSQIYVHPHTTTYHIDIMVDWDVKGQRTGIFFVSFPADLLVRPLRHGQLPGHRLLLLKQDVPGLVEVAAEGSRDALQREFKLTPEENVRIGYVQAVPGTAWNLVDLPAAGLFEGMARHMWWVTGFTLFGFLAVTGVVIFPFARTVIRNERLEYMRRHDPRSGMPNGFALLERLERMLAKRREDRRPFALLLLRPDGFGKPRGNFFDRTSEIGWVDVVSARFRPLFGKCDLLAHLGGGDLGLLLCRGDEAQTSKIAAQLREVIDSVCDEGIVSGPVSIGVASYPKDGEDPAALVRSANAALYAARQKGGGTVYFSNLGE